MDDSYIHQAAVYAFEGLECEQKHHYQAASQAFTKAAETLLRGGRSDTSQRRQRTVRLRIAEYLTRAETLKLQPDPPVPSLQQDTGANTLDQTPPSASEGDVQDVLRELTTDLDTDDNPHVPVPTALATDPSLLLQDTPVQPATCATGETATSEQPGPTQTGVADFEKPSPSDTSVVSPNESTARSVSDSNDSPTARAVIDQGKAAVQASTAETVATWKQAFGNQLPQDDWMAAMPKLRYSKDEDELVKQQYFELFGTALDDDLS
eukprot:m.27570 g.27570  ORF g.27570 m.27570 type:complete len:265 (-) comp11759_c0_seq3:15-809(-)